MLVYPWARQYFPIKSIQHFIETSPTYKAQSKELIVWFDSVNQCLSIKYSDWSNFFMFN